MQPAMTRTEPFVASISRRASVSLGGYGGRIADHRWIIAKLVLFLRRMVLDVAAARGVMACERCSDSDWCASRTTSCLGWSEATP